MSEEERNPRNERPVSLHPLSVEQALGKAMSPSDEPPKPTKKKRRSKKKRKS